MNPSEEEIINVKRRYEDIFLRFDNVHAVSIGYKMVCGKKTNIIAIVVHTVRKKKIEDIPRGQVIPECLEGIPTDVVEMPPFQILPIQLGDKYVETATSENEKLRPVPGGAEIFSPVEEGPGGICTLGMFARSRKAGDNPDDIYLVTNAHCLPYPDQQVRQPVSQSAEDAIAYATRTVSSEQVDGGIAKMIRNTDANPYEILNIGVPLGTYTATLDNIGEYVIKTGRTTNTTEGYIAYVDVTLIDIRNQIIIASDLPFAAPGDSGSVVLLRDGEFYHHVIGLLWGGVLTYAILCPIDVVSEELEIELLTFPK